MKGVAGRWFPRKTDYLMSFKLWKRKYILKKNYEKKKGIQVTLSKNNVAVSFLSAEFNVFDDRHYQKARKGWKQ